MKKILAVNLDAISLSSISSLLMEHTQDIELLTTKKVGEIDAVIKKLSAEIVLIDLVDPSPQELKTLKALSKAYPKLPLMAMTALETGEIASTIKSINTLRYFEKPVDFEKIVNAVWERIERSVGGEIHGISLTSFLQMSEMEKTSCVLKIKTDKQVGSLYLLKGTLIAAETGALKNEEAVLEVLSWDNPVIEIVDSPVSRQKAIETPLISLLMESARRKDEKRGKKKAAPAKKARKATPAADGAAPRKKAAKKAAESEPAEAEQAPPEEEVLPDQLQELRAAGKITDASQILKRKQRISQLTKVLAGILAVLIVFCVWRFAVNPWLANKEFDRVVADTRSAESVEKKIEILSQYLAAGPSVKLARQAEEMKRTYENDLESLAYEKAVQMVNALPLDENFQETAKATYSQFLKQFPNGPHKEDIARRIKGIPAIMDDAEYTRLKQIPENLFSERLQAYQAYLSKNPDSANADNVRKMHDGLGQAFYEYLLAEKKACDESQSWQKGIKLCQYFLDNFKTHERTEDVALLQQRMAAQSAYLKVTEEVEKAGPMSGKAAGLLKQYLQEYPDSPYKDEVKERIFRFDQGKDQETAWKELVIYVRDNRNTIFDRVERMEFYLNSNPSGKHLQEARDIHAWLLKEKDKSLQQMNQQAAAEQRRRQMEQILDQERKKIARQVQQSGGRFSIIKQDTITDNRTGLTWCMFDSSVLSSACMDYKAAERYARSLNVGGFSDWRLPDPSELLVLYNGKPAFPMSNAEWYWTSEVFSAAWQTKVNTVVKTGTGIWKKKETDLKKCGAVRAVRP